ncbi:MAG: D-Ala-D-Ala carboxypeptidase family metallohydrolase, partial [Waterburya sp.]
EKNGKSAGEKVIMVTSGYRDPATNAANGGVQNSQHTQGLALDIFPTVGNPLEFENWLIANWSGAVGMATNSGRNFTHIDGRGYTGKFPDKPGTIRFPY